MMHMKLEEYAPGEIEKRSFAIIEEELGRELDPVQKPIIKRVIHTTADFSYADTLFFSEGAVEEGLNALRSGVSIVTDTNMGKAGINKKKLGQLGGSVHCFMADEDVAEKASRRGITRAAVSMEKTAEMQEDFIFAIGNAPTALIRLYELIKEGRIHPPPHYRGSGGICERGGGQRTDSYGRRACDSSKRPQRRKQCGCSHMQRPALPAVEKS